MKKQFYFIAIFCFAMSNAKSQYFYKDILTNKQLSSELGIYKQEKIKEIGVTSLENDGMPSEGFFCKKEISKDYTQIEIVTQTATSYKTILTSTFSKQGLLLRTNDSSEVSVTNSSYTYSVDNKIVTISAETHFAQDDYEDNNFEDHHYSFDKEGNLSNLIVVKNKKDTLHYIFSLDENKNVTIEKNIETGDLYYYYYDNKNRLTDIVHKYKNQKKVTTDYIFQYNQANQLAQMKVAEEEGAYYFVWKYNYDGNLRSTERCYSKEGKLMGSIEYKYR
jgi:hypothetical protein